MGSYINIFYFSIKTIEYTYLGLVLILGYGINKSTQHQQIDGKEMKKPSMSTCVNSAHYDKMRIAYELEQTALGNAYYGNSLRVAKDIPGLEPENISLLERWLSDRDTCGDGHDLQRLAMDIAGK